MNPTFSIFRTMTHYADRPLFSFSPFPACSPTLPHPRPGDSNGSSRRRRRGRSSLGRFFLRIRHTSRRTIAENRACPNMGGAQEEGPGPRWSQQRRRAAVGNARGGPPRQDYR